MSEKTGETSLCAVCDKKIPQDDELCDDCYVMVLMYEYGREQEPN